MSSPARRRRSARLAGLFDRRRRAIKTQVQAIWETMEAETFSACTLEERVLLRRFLIQLRDNLRRAVGE